MATNAPTTRVAHIVRRAQWRVAMFSIACVSLLLALTGLIALREYELRAMELTARSIALAGEPAIRFNDRAAMRELIEQLAMPAQLAEDDVTDAHGQAWLRFEQPVGDASDRWARRIEHWLVGTPASASIGPERSSLGRIALRSDGDTLMRYVLRAVLALLLCVAAAALVVWWHSRRLAAAIVAPIDALALLTHQVRESRSFERRAGRAAVAEVDALADDFNALLSELQSQQMLIEQRHADLQRVNASLWTLSHHDALTSLPNRTYLRMHLAKAMEQEREPGHRIGLVFIDADRFKQINDRHGHAAGDALLIELAERLRRSIRESDFIARLGGDEFVVVLEPMRHALDVSSLTDRIQAEMNRLVVLKPGVQLPHISVSMGVAVFPDHADTLDGLIRAADDAMYRAKSTARGSVVNFLPIKDTTLPATTPPPSDDST
ncbi:MAG TPA: diguanylate cyclase [Burkholderiaceae bacterium]